MYDKIDGTSKLQFSLFHLDLNLSKITNNCNLEWSGFIIGRVVIQDDVFHLRLQENAPMLVVSDFPKQKKVIIEGADTIVIRGEDCAFLDVLIIDAGSINFQSHIVATKDIGLTARYSITVFGSLMAENIHCKAGTITNKGKLIAKQAIGLKAQENIQQDGYLKSNILILHGNTVVTNIQSVITSKEISAIVADSVILEGDLYFGDNMFCESRELIIACPISKSVTTCIETEMLQIKDAGQIEFSSTLISTEDASEIKIKNLLVDKHGKLKLSNLDLSSLRIDSLGEIELDHCNLHVDSMRLAGNYSIKNGDYLIENEAILFGNNSSVLECLKFKAENITFMGENKGHDVDFFTDDMLFAEYSDSEFTNSSFESVFLLSLNESATIKLENTFMDAEAIHFLGNAGLINCTVESDTFVTSKSTTLTACKILAIELWKDTGSKTTNCEIKTQSITLQQQTSLYNCQLETNTLGYEGIGVIENSHITVTKYMHGSKNSNLTFKHSFVQCGQNYSRGILNLTNGSYYQTDYMQQSAGCIRVNNSVLNNIEMLYTVEGATLIAESEGMLELKSVLCEGDTQWEHSKMRALGPVIFCGKTTGENSKIYCQDSIYISNGELSLNKSEIMIKKQIVTKNKLVLDQSILTCKTFVALDNDTFIKNSQFHADDLIFFSSFRATNSLIKLKTALDSFYNSVATLNAVKIIARSVQFGGDLDVKKSKLITTENINFSKKSRVERVILEAGENIIFQRDSTLTGTDLITKSKNWMNSGSIELENLSIQAHTIKNMGEMDTEQLHFRASMTMNNMGVIRSNYIKGQSLAFLNTFGSMISTENMTIQSPLLMNLCSRLGAYASQNIDSLIHFNLLGLECGYDMHVRSLLDYNLGMRLAFLPSSLKSVFTVPRALGFSRMALTHNLPHYSNVISLGSMLCTYTQKMARTGIDLLKSDFSFKTLPRKIYDSAQYSLAIKDASDLLPMGMNMMSSGLGAVNFVKCATGSHDEIKSSYVNGKFIFSLEDNNAVPMGVSDLFYKIKSAIKNPFALEDMVAFEQFKVAGEIAIKAFGPSMNMQTVISSHQGITLSINVSESAFSEANWGLKGGWNILGDYTHGVNRGTLFGVNAVLTGKTWENFNVFIGRKKASLIFSERVTNALEGYLGGQSMHMKSKYVTNYGSAAIDNLYINAEFMYNMGQADTKQFHFKASKLMLNTGTIKSDYIKGQTSCMLNLFGRVHSRKNTTIQAPLCLNIMGALTSDANQSIDSLLFLNVAGAVLANDLHIRTLVRANFGLTLPLMPSSLSRDNFFTQSRSVGVAQMALSQILPGFHNAISLGAMALPYASQSKTYLYDFYTSDSPLSTLPHKIYDSARSSLSKYTSELMIEDPSDLLPVAMNLMSTGLTTIQFSRCAIGTLGEIKSTIHYGKDVVFSEASKTETSIVDSIRPNYTNACNVLSATYDISKMVFGPSMNLQSIVSIDSIATCSVNLTERSFYALNYGIKYGLNININHKHAKNHGILAGSNMTLTGKNWENLGMIANFQKSTLFISDKLISADGSTLMLTNFNGRIKELIATGHLQLSNGRLNGESLTISGTANLSSVLAHFSGNIDLAKIIFSNFDEVKLIAGKNIINHANSMLKGTSIGTNSAHMINHGFIGIDKFSAQANIIRNTGKMDTHQDYFKANVAMINTGTIEAEDIKGQALALLNLRGRIHTKKNTTLQAPLRVNVLGTVTSESQLNIDSIVDLNLLGLESGYDMNIRNVLDLNYGLRLPYLHGSRGGIFSEHRIKTFFRMTLSQVFPSVRNIISLGTLAFPYAKQSASYLYDFKKSNTPLSTLPHKIYDSVQSTLSDYVDEHTIKDTSDLLPVAMDMMSTALTTIQLAGCAEGTLNEMKAVIKEGKEMFFSEAQKKDSSIDSAIMPAPMNETLVDSVLMPEPLNVVPVFGAAFDVASLAFGPSLTIETVISYGAGWAANINFKDSAFYAYNLGVKCGWNMIGDYSYIVNKGIYSAANMTLTSKSGENFGILGSFKKSALVFSDKLRNTAAGYLIVRNGTLETKELSSSGRIKLSGVVTEAESITQTGSLVADESTLNGKYISLSGTEQNNLTNCNVNGDKIVIKENNTISETLFKAKDTIIFEKTGKLKTHNSAFIAGNEIMHYNNNHIQTGTLLFKAKNVESTLSTNLSSGKYGENTFYVESETGNFQGIMVLDNGVFDVKHLNKAEDLIWQTGQSAQQVFSKSLTIKTDATFNINQNTLRDCNLDVTGKSILVTKDYKSSRNLSFTATQGKIKIKGNMSADKLVLRSEKNNVEVFGKTLEGTTSVYAEANRNIIISATEEEVKGKHRKGKHRKEKKYTPGLIKGGSGNMNTDNAGVILIAGEKLLVDASNLSATGKIILSGYRGVGFKARSHSYRSKHKSSNKRFWGIKYGKKKMEKTETQVVTCTISSTEDQIQVFSSKGKVTGVGGAFIAKNGTEIYAHKDIDMNGLSTETTIRKETTGCFGLNSKKKKEKHEEVECLDFISGGGETRFYSETGNINGTDLRFKGSGGVTFEAPEGYTLLKSSTPNHSIETRERKADVSTPFIESWKQSGTKKRFIQKAEPILGDVGASYNARSPLEQIATTSNLAISSYNSASALAGGTYAQHAMQNVGLIPKINVSLTYTLSTTQYQTGTGAAILIEGDIVFKTKDGVVMEGMPLAADNLIIKTKKIKIAGQYFESKNTIKSHSITAGITTTGVSDVSGAYSSQKRTESKYLNTPIHIKNKATIEAQSMELDGSNLTCNSIDMDVDKLTIQSRQDKLNQSNKSFSASTTGAVSASQNQIRSQEVNQVAGIHVTSGITKENMRVREANLNGGEITSDVYNDFTPDQLNTMNLKDCSHSREIGISGNINSIICPPNNSKSNRSSALSTINVSHAKGDHEAKRLATVSGQEGSNKQLLLLNPEINTSAQSTLVICDKVRTIKIEIPVNIVKSSINAGLNFFDPTPQQIPFFLDKTIKISPELTTLIAKKTGDTSTQESIAKTVGTEKMAVETNEMTSVTIKRIESDSTGVSLKTEQAVSEDIITEKLDPALDETPSTAQLCAFNPYLKTQAFGLKSGRKDMQMYSKIDGRYTNLKKECQISVNNNQSSTNTKLTIIEGGNKASGFYYNVTENLLENQFIMQAGVGKEYTLNMTTNNNKLGSYSVDACSAQALIKTQLSLNPTSAGFFFGGDIGIMGPSVVLSSHNTPEFQIMGLTIQINAEVSGGVGLKATGLIGAKVNVTKMKIEGLGRIGLFAGPGRVLSIKPSISIDTKFIENHHEAYKEIVEQDSYGTSLLEKVKNNEILTPFEHDYFDTMMDEVGIKAQISGYFSK